MSDDDFLSMITGGKERIAPPPKAANKAVAPLPPSFTDDNDALIRTVYGEADPEGRKAVAAVIRNRAAKSGKKLADVVLEKGQFEAWMRPDARARMMALKADSPEYQAIAAEVADMTDPTGGADSYYAPKLQTELGRAKPAWDDGTGTQIGSQLYFKGKYGGKPSADDDFLGMITGGKDYLKDTKPVEYDMANASDIVLGGGKESLTQAQYDFAAKMRDAKQLDTKERPGSQNNPYYMPEGGVPPEAPDAYYIDRAGVLHKTPGTTDSVRGGMEGFATGLGDVFNTVDTGITQLHGALLPKDKRDELIYNQQNALTVNRALNEAKYGDNPFFTGGQIAGQIAGTAPIMAVGGAALSPAARAAGPVGNFLAGSAGQGAGMGNLLLRGGSLATRGGIEGATASGLVSSAQDRPFDEQIREGGALGAAFGLGAPIAGALGKKAGQGVNALLEPLTEAGQIKKIGNLLQDVSGEAPVMFAGKSKIPGVNLTLAQSVKGGNAGLSAMERAKVADPNFNSQFIDQMKANNEARRDFVKDIVGTADDVAKLEQERERATSGLRRQAFAIKSPTDPSPVVDFIDATLAGPEGQRDAVVDALTAIRSKLVRTDATGKTIMQTDPEQLYGIRKAINDSLDPLTRGTAADKRMASRELLGLKDELDLAIEKGAPGFKNYIDEYAARSKPIDELRALQEAKFTDGTDLSDGRITLGKVKTAITSLEAMRGKAGVNKAKSITDKKLDQLYTLYEDLQKEAQSGLGRGAGSDTVPKAAMLQTINQGKLPQLAENILSGASGLGTYALQQDPLAAFGASALVKTATHGVNKLYAAKNEELANRLTAALLNPDNAKSALNQSFRIAPKRNVIGSALKSQAIPASIIAQRNLLTGSGAQ